MEAESCQKPESNGSKSDDEEEEILGSDNDEQEDPKDYCKGQFHRLIAALNYFKSHEIMCFKCLLLNVPSW